LAGQSGRCSQHLGPHSPTKHTGYLCVASACQIATPDPISIDHRSSLFKTLQPEGQLGGGGGTVEVDETFWGNKGKHAQGARSFHHQMKVVSLVEREGFKRSFHVRSVNAKTLGPILRSYIAKDAALMTDET
jgi:hypothetical protein